MKLIANGIQLDLNQGTAFNFEFTSPLFKTSVEAEAYSYPVELPNTIRNRQFFKYLNRPDSSAKFVEIPCILRDSTDILRGQIHVLKATEKAFSISILKNAWDADILEKSLRTINLGGIRPVGDMLTHANWTVTKSVDQADYVFFPVYNPNFYDQSGNFLGIVNNWSVLNQTFINNPLLDANSSGNSPYDPNRNTLVPFPYLVYVLKQVAATFGKTLSGSFAHNSEIKTLVVYNTFAVDAITEDINGGYFANTFKTTIDVANHVPDITIASLLNGLMRQFNLSIQITENNLEIDFKESFLNQSVKYDMSNIAERYPSVEPFRSQAANGYKFQMGVDTSDELWKELEKNVLRKGETFNPVPYRGNLPTSTVANQTQFVIYYNAWYRATSVGTFKLDFVKTDDVGYAPQYITGQGKEVIQTDIGTLVMRKHVPAINEILDIKDFGLLPSALQKGNSPEEQFGIGAKNEYGLRLLFYRGLQPNFDAQLYPLGSSDIYNTMSANNGAVGQKGMLLENIYQQNYKSWLDIVDNAKALNLELGLDAAKLSAFDMTAKYRVNQQNILPEKMSVSWTDKGVKKARMRALKF
jgi:hypothetical protein